MERKALYESIKTKTWQQQLGDLASTLATISTQATIPQQDKLTIHLLREAALIIEWCVQNIPELFHPVSFLIHNIAILILVRCKVDRFEAGGRRQKAGLGVLHESEKRYKAFKNLSNSNLYDLTYT